MIQNLQDLLNSRWLEIVDIFRVEAANLNAGEGGPAQIDVKTIHLEDGTLVPRISPQAIFRMVRDFWIESKYPVDIARNKPGVPAPQPTCDPAKFIDDDLFGYLNASKGESDARPGPIRSIGAVGLFEYPDDTDFLTSIVSTTGSEAGGSMVSKRLYTNTFILPVWCDVRRIGAEMDPTEEKTLRQRIFDGVDRQQRLRAFFEALFYLGKATPGSSKPPLTPKLIMIGAFSKPNISLYDALQNDLSVRIKEVKLQRETTRTGEEKIVSVATGKVEFSLDFKAFAEKCRFYDAEIQSITIGVMESFFVKNAEEMKADLVSAINTGQNDNPKSEDSATGSAKANERQPLPERIKILPLVDLKNTLLGSGGQPSQLAT